MLSLPSIDDPVRLALDAQVRHFSRYVACANIAVAVGVALEGLELAYKAGKWTKRKIRQKRERLAHHAVSRILPVGELMYATEAHSDDPTWLKTLLFIGLLGVVGGVVAEWQYGTKLEDAHNAVHRYDLWKIEAADEKAGNAESSAQGAAIASASATADAKTAKDDSNAAENTARAAREQANLASTLSKEAEAKSAEVAKEADDLLKKYLAAESQIARMDAARLELEQTLAPRIITMIWDKGKSNLEPLRVFRDRPFKLEYLPDTEAIRAASSLRDVFTSGGMKFESAKVKPDAFDVFFDGVTIYVPTALTGEENQRSFDTGEKLKAFLEGFGWQQIKWMHADKGELQPGEIKVVVGFKPSPYFRSEEEKEADKERLKMKRYAEEMERQLEERRKQVEEIIREHKDLEPAPSIPALPPK